MAKNGPTAEFYADIAKRGKVLEKQSAGLASKQISEARKFLKSNQYGTAICRLLDAQSHLKKAAFWRNDYAEMAFESKYARSKSRKRP